MAYGDVVQSNSANTNGATLDVAYSSNVTAGNTLVAVGGNNTNGQTLTGSNNTFVALTDIVNPFDMNSVLLAYVLSATGGAETVQEASGGTFKQLAVIEFEGASEEVFAEAGAGSFGSAAASGNITVDSTDIENGDVLIVGYGGLTQVYSYTPAAMSTIEYEGATLSLHVSSFMQSGAGTYQSAGTWGGSGNWAEGVAGFKPAAAPAGSAVPIFMQQMSDLSVGDATMLAAILASSKVKNRREALAVLGAYGASLIPGLRS